MNKTKIEWCDYTWNPITGCLGHCPYCYARKISMRFHDHFRPTIHPERMISPNKIKNSSRVFVGSMADMWGDWVPKEWIDEVLAVVRECSQHQYIFLTKNPQRYLEFDIPRNCLRGTTITNRIQAIELTVPVDLISFEPLLESMNDFALPRLRWVIVGAQTNPYKPPKKEWVDGIVRQARVNGIPIFLKNNLKWPEKIQEFPQGGASQVSK